MAKSSVGELDERGGRGGRRVELAEQAVLLLADAGGEVERVHVAAVAAVAELQGPQLVDHDAVAALVLERAEEGAGRRVVGVDAGVALAEVADEQRAAEDAERWRARCVTPHGALSAPLLIPKVRSRTPLALNRRTKPLPTPVLGRDPPGADLGVGDVERAADGLNVVGVVGVPRRRRDGRVGEGEAGRGLQGERAVENVNLAVGEVGRVEEVARAVVGDGEPGVDVAGVAGRDDGRGRAGGRGVRVPARDVARDRGEEEVRPARRGWRTGPGRTNSVATGLATVPVGRPPGMVTVCGLGLSVTGAPGARRRG